MGKYNVIPTIIAAKNEQRAQDEQNYIATRRTVKDKREDELAGLSDAARAERISKYGAQGYDTTNLGQTEGIDQRRQLLPGVIEQQGLTTESLRTSNEQADVNLEDSKGDAAAKIGQREREAAMRTLDAIEASGATTVQEIAQLIPPAMMAQLGTDPAKAPQLFETLGKFPDLKTGINALRDGLSGQEKVTSTVTGIGPDGKPVLFGIGDRQKPGVVEGVRPGGPNDDLNRQLLAAQVEATKALANQRNTPKGAGADQTPEQAAAAGQALLDTIGDMKTQLNGALQSGAITSDRTDPITNMFSGDNPAGRFIAGLTGDPKETQRKQIDDTATMLLTSLINSPGMSSRLFDSNAEKDTWTAMLGKTGSYEARIEAINKFERFAAARLADPSRIGRADPSTPAPTQSAPVAGGNLSQRQDGVYVWTPGTD